jgi:uncharacterized protein (DUF488 family)
VSRIWTVGYERTGIPGFITTLKAAKIKTLIDVREVANSRRAGFSKKALTANLAAAGIAYIHLNALGTPKAGREAARKGDIKTMHRLFRARLVEPQSQLALAEVAELADKARVCLMCLEHDWRVCHRSIVTEELEAFDIKAVHLSPEMSP